MRITTSTTYELTIDLVGHDERADKSVGVDREFFVDDIEAIWVVHGESYPIEDDRGSQIGNGWRETRRHNILSGLDLKAKNQLVANLLDADLGYFNQLIAEAV